MQQYLTILLALKVVMNEADGTPTNKLTGDALDASKSIGSDATTVEEASACAKWKAYIEAARVKINAEATSRAQVRALVLRYSCDVYSCRVYSCQHHLCV
jgi:hypothetical protein